jgi:cytoskeletal protein CcmA (bactofilin family)
VYRGTNVVISDTAELINCRIIGLETFADGKLAAANKNLGTIEIKGVFYNMTPKKFAILTMDRVLISPGARVVGNICADRIIVTELTRIRGRLASRDLVLERRARKQGVQNKETQTQQSSQENLETETAGGSEIQTNEKLDEVIS